MVTEAFGTACLVFAGTGAIVANEVSGGAITHIGIALTFGLIVMVMIFATGHISGAHINPAVTLAFAVTKHVPWSTVPKYWLAQLVGASVGSLLVAVVIGDGARLGATLPLNGAVGSSFVLEIILTMILMFVIMSVATDERAQGSLAAVAIGSTVALEAMFAGPISGASMNPARSLGPALVGTHWADHWIYWVGPIVGAVLGALLYVFIRGQSTASVND
jgi:MIP family channel proteins